jgi:hypothetical protein
MAGPHALLAWLTVGATVAVLIAALPAAIGGQSSRRWIDRAILLQVASTVGACLAGAAVALTGRGPGDLLHFVYALSVLVLVPGARYAVHDATERRFAGWIAVAALITMGALLRSFMTGR